MKKEIVVNVNRKKSGEMLYKFKPKTIKEKKFSKKRKQNEKYKLKEFLK